MLHFHGNTFIATIYVNYFGINGNNIDLILGLKRQFVHTFEITNINLLHLFLSIQVLQMFDGLLKTKTLDLQCLMPLAWIFNDLKLALTNLVNKAFKKLKKQTMTHT